MDRAPPRAALLRSEQELIFLLLFGGLTGLNVSNLVEFNFFQWKNAKHRGPGPARALPPPLPPTKVASGGGALLHRIQDVGARPWRQASNNEHHVELSSNSSTTPLESYPWPRPGL